MAAVPLERRQQAAAKPTAETRAGRRARSRAWPAIYHLRGEALLTRRQLVERMETTQSVISHLEEGGGARNRIDTLARATT